MKDLSKATTYKTPFSLAYWRDAAAQLGDVRILCIAAVLIAVRVALKMAQFPVGPDLNVQIGFLVNALGASIFGPVIAILAATVSDILGAVIFPSKGPFFAPFMIVEIAGSLTFALWLWRAKLSASRVILSRFSVVAICNLILNPSIMIWYYDWLNNGKSYALITLPRVVKNLTLFPVEALVLVVFLSAMIPLLAKMRIIPKEQTKPVMTAKHYVLLGILFLAAIAIVAAYYFLYLPNK